MVAVLSEVGCERVALLGLVIPIGLLFAATHPERTTAVVVVNGSARFRRADDYPQGYPDEEIDQRIESRPNRASFAILDPAPSLVDDTRFQRWSQRAGRLTTHRTIGSGDCVVPTTWTFVMCSARSGHPPWSSTAGTVVSPTRPATSPNILRARSMSRCRARTCFPSWVTQGRCSTRSKSSSPGNSRGHRSTGCSPPCFYGCGRSTCQGGRARRPAMERAAGHPRRAGRRRSRTFRGRAVKFTGDGVLATFDGPARRSAAPVRSARAATARDRGTPGTAQRRDRVAWRRRRGYHHPHRATRRIGRGAGEVLVSRTVADLLAGSEIDFEDRGERELKGVSGTWRVFSAGG